MTLYELCEAIEDPVLDAQCLLGLGRCDDDRACPAHDFSKSLRKRKLEFLRRTTLADLGRYEEARLRGRAARRRKKKR